jgi:hypothetical protein
MQNCKFIQHTAGVIASLFLLQLACTLSGRSPAVPTEIVLTATGTPVVIPTETPSVAAVIAEDGAWVIFSQSKAEQIYVDVSLPSDANFEGYWTPTMGDILDIEARLGDFLQQNADQFFLHPTVWEQLNEYHRQYVGLMVDGKRLIYGNFFCTDMGTDWTQDWVVVLDGGDCFFQTTYDVESGTFIRLRVNGEA